MDEQPSMYMNERTPHQPCITSYIGCTTLTACWIAIPYQYDKITMVNNPMTGSKIRIFKAGSQRPYFRVFEDDLRRVIRWGSLDAQLPVIISRVRHTGDLLMIHIYGQSASLCHHGEQVRLIKPWGDRWRGALLQG